MNRSDMDFWYGMGKGVDLSLEVLSDELKNADQKAQLIISKLIELIRDQKKKIDVIRV